MSNVDNNKPYQLSYELRPEYLYVMIKGEKIDYEIARQYWNEIIEIREQANTRFLLVDKNVQAELSTADEFQIAKELSTIALKRVKLAICDRHVSQECLEFGEMVATNRGLNTKSFRDTAAAEKWLLAN
ncbi:MAG: hypothetical protein IPL32_01750 [Chloracidobacterium sp.]|nr:hypothetical protein [Chloracidobacterium sp.]